MIMPDSTFGQVKPTQSIYLSPKELAYINLEEYLRGSFMTYTPIVKMIDNSGNYNEIFFGHDQALASVTEPFVTLAHEDFNQTTQ